MKDSLKIAKEKLIERWIDAYDEMDGFKEFQAQTTSFKYADIFSYDLKEFKNGKIAAGSKLWDEPHEQSYGKYGFNKDGFLTTAEIHNKGELTWIGFFSKNENLIEYLEFNIDRKAPSCIKRIFLKDGKKVLYQSASTNGRSGFHSNDGAGILEQVHSGFNDGHSVICTVEEYQYKNDLIDRAYGMNIMPGGGEYAFEDVYAYNNKKLEGIKTYFEDGTQSIKYIARSKTTLKTLSNELADKFCDYLIAVLKKQSLDTPLFSVELCYQYCYTYWPHLVIIKADQKNETIANNDSDLFTNGKFIYATEEIPAGLEELYTEFYQSLETSKNWEAGRIMLKQLAKLMTESKLKGKIPVTDDFIVFPIEWELEGGELEKILAQCGASKTNIKKWKQYGWV